MEDKTLYKIKTKSVPGIYLWYFFILSTATGGLIPVGSYGMLGRTLILAGGAMVMSFPKIVGNSILLGK